MSAANANPLLSYAKRDDGVTPPFDAIAPEHVGPAIEALASALQDDLVKLETALGERLKSGEKLTWTEVVDTSDDVTGPLGRAWGVVGHLKGVCDSEPLREAHAKAQPVVVENFMRVGQSRTLYDAVVALRKAPAQELDAAQIRILDASIRDAELAGVALEGDAKTRFNEIAQRSSELGTLFQNHVLDATKAFELHLTKEEDVEGTTKSWRTQAAEAAKAKEKEGWLVTLDYPSYSGFMRHAIRRDLREQVYRAFVSRASEGDLDNTPVMNEILALRQEKAKLLGFETFAELSLARKMAGSVDEIEQLLVSLVDASKTAAEKDLADLRELATSGVAGAPENGELLHWDLEFLSERLREARFAYTDEEIRPYFSLERVLDGLFSLTERLFGVKVRAADGEVPVWNKDVRFFRIEDEAGAEVAAFFLDPFSRPADKRGGAWMDECVSRRLREGETAARVPIAYLVCNQTPPTADTPSLMSFREVETLFHEFGHGLQHMLTKVDYEGASGITGVEWDAVELPSQFMENWCYQRETLLGMSGHHETGEKLPEELFEKIVAARNFRAGWMMLRQVQFARTDLELHHRFTPGGDESVFDVDRRIAKETLVMLPHADDRFLCAFGHIFAGGYAAGYYSYKWAEVLSADAFGAFEDAGLDDDAKVREVGGRFRETVLALGGSVAPAEVFKAFRGRAPTTDALLRHSGLVRPAA